MCTSTQLPHISPSCPHLLFSKSPLACELVVLVYELDQEAKEMNSSVAVLLI